MPKPYSRELRDDVVRVAHGREPGVTVEQIARDFGASTPVLSHTGLSLGAPAASA